MHSSGNEIPQIADGELLAASTLEEIRLNAERRLRQIEPLIEEAERLRDVLVVIGRGSLPHAPRAGGEQSNTSPRAAKGANKRVILELVGQRPGITPAQIAAATGVKRTVVASTVSRLKRNGELCEHQRGGVCLASGPAPTRGADLVAVQ
jgi:winged helix-turn-helix DNA-binding protein